MRHVDDGTLHAWLDGEVTDPAVVAWVDAHLRDCTECATRLADARSTIEHADALLALSAPAFDTPPFARIVERADAPAAGVPRRRQWALAAGWAASVLLAAALGWAARDLAMPGAPAPAAIVAEAPRPAREAIAIGGSRPAPAPDALPDADSAFRERMLDANAAAQEGTPPAQRRERAATGIMAPPPGARSATRAPAADAPGAAVTDEPRPAEIQPVRRGDVSREGAAPRTETAATAAPSTSAPGAVRRVQGATPLPSVSVGVSPEVQTRPALAALSSAEAVPQSLPASAPQPPAVGRALRGVVGDAAGAVAIAADSAGERLWRTVSRTEAAALTGMPLYGIEGLMPALTLVDPLVNTVRTVYQLPSGSSLELLQEPLRDPLAGGALFAQPAQAPAAGGAARAGNAIADPLVWSGVRGTVRLTLRALSGLPEVSDLSARIRLD